MFYGAQYYRPPFPVKEDWERDFANMEKQGFNCVKLWAVWNWIEKEPGKFAFQELDELVELAKKHQLGVIINTIPEGAPYWIYTGREEDLYHTADGQKIHCGGPANIPSGGWPGLCMDNPEFAGLAANFIEKTAAHFADENSVVAIDVWNEPHLEPMYDYRSELLCYCHNSQAEFRAWLREKYHSLEALNKAWHRTYTQWSQVTPPPRFGTWADMLDWRRFWLDNMRRWLRLRVDASRKGAPNIKVQTHVAYSGILGNKIVGGLANELGDEFSLVNEVDLFGLSSFPKWLMGEEHRYRHLIHNEMISCAAGEKLFYQVELQGGGGKPGLLGGEVPTAEDVSAWNWNTIATGGKGSVYWQYAPEPAGIESPGFGLVGFRGEETSRSKMASRCARELNTSLLQKAQKDQIVNAIYVSRDSDLLCFAAGRKEEMYAGSLSGVFKAAYNNGVPITFLHQDQIKALKYPDIQVLFLPMPLIITDEEKKSFKSFMNDGGTIVTEACPGLYGADGLLEQKAVVLKELFGLEHVEIQAVKEWGEVNVEWEFQEGGFTGRFYRQLVKPVDDSVESLARFEDGETAVTKRHVGKGQAIWIGTFPSYHYEYAGTKGSENVLLKWMVPGGYPEIQAIDFHSNEKETISQAPVVRLLTSGTSKILVFVNHCDYDNEIKVLFESGKEIRVQLSAGQGTSLELKTEL